MGAGVRRLEAVPSGEVQRKPKPRRKSISKTTRFEVFKRDAFTCQYCGKKAPDVVLVLDHICPVSKGGANEIINYATSCVDCNTGKGARELSDGSLIVKQRKQLDELHARKEQLEMLVKWRQGLMQVEECGAIAAVEYWNARAAGWSANESGIAMMRQWVRKFSVDEIMKAIEAATSAYIVIQDRKATAESIQRAWNSIQAICRVNRVSVAKPYLRDLYYIRGILRRRFELEIGDRERVAIYLLESAHLSGAPIDELKAWAVRAGAWGYWTKEMYEWIGELDSAAGTENE